MTSKQLENFNKKVIKITEGCWEWVGAKNDDGYGYFGINGSSTAAHRVSYMHWIGEINPDMHIDHKCRNRACVNPSHLEQVTKQENDQKRLINLKEYCKNGHPIGNTVGKDGRRRCKECNRKQVQRHKNKKRSLT